MPSLTLLIRVCLITLLAGSEHTGSSCPCQGGHCLGPRHFPSYLHAVWVLFWLPMQHLRPMRTSFVCTPFAASHCLQPASFAGTSSSQGQSQGLRRGCWKGPACRESNVVGGFLHVLERGVGEKKGQLKNSTTARLFCRRSVQEVRLLCFHFQTVTRDQQELRPAVSLLVFGVCDVKFG